MSEWRNQPSPTVQTVVQPFARCLSLCLCATVCHKSGVLSNRAGFWHTGASFHLSYNVLKGNLGIYKNNSTSSGTLSQTPDVRNLLRRIDRRNVLSTLLDKGGRSERNKLDRRRSAKLTIPPSPDVRPLVYHSNRQALSTTLFRRGGL